MPAHFSIQAGSRRSTCGNAELIFRIMSAVAITLSMTVDLEVSFASGQSGFESSGHFSRQVVNRIQKGNRLLEASAFQLTVMKKTRDVTSPRVPFVNLKLLEGCDALVSPLADSRLARVAARCVS